VDRHRQRLAADGSDTERLAAHHSTASLQSHLAQHDFDTLLLGHADQAARKIDRITDRRGARPLEPTFSTSAVPVFMSIRTRMSLRSGWMAGEA
jgi:hypothetical protein